MSLYAYYVEATKMMGQPSWFHLREEIDEFLESRTKGEYIEESADIVHTICRCMNFPNRVTYLLANKTAVKHAVRTLKRGCPKSERNCKKAAETCCCKKKESN